MALQIGVALTTRNNFSVPAGAYVWLKEDRGTNLTYNVRVELIFFKDKASFDAGKSRFFPFEIPDTLMSFSQDFTPSAYAVLTPMTIHNFVKAQLETVLGANNVTIVS